VEFTALDYAFHPGNSQVNLCFCVTFVSKRRPKILKVFGQGFSAGRSLRVKQSYVCKPLSQLCWYILQPAGQRSVQRLTTGRPPEPHKPLNLPAKRLRLLLVREGRKTSHRLQVVAQLDIPFFRLNGLAAFVSIRRSENSHKSPAFFKSV
jgi:hypothetical protein